jgi:PAS domain S-box-containing protein
MHHPAEMTHPMSRPIFVRYLLAAAAVGLSFAIKPAIDAWVGPGPPLMFFVPAVTFAAWQGGLGPGLLATALSQCLCLYFYMHPGRSFWIEAPNDRFRLVVFGADGVLTSFLMGQLLNARRQAEASATEAEKYRDTLRQSERRLQAMMDNAPAVIYLKDREGRYVLINHAFEVLFGLSGHQVEGKTDLDIFPTDVAEIFRAHDRGILESGKAIEWEDSLSLAGETRTYLTIKFPVLDSEGSPQAVGGFSADISGRKRAELALRESEERFRTLSACSPVGIYQTDAEGRCTYNNPRCQEIYGFAPGEGLGEGWTQYIHPDDRERVVGRWSEAARLGEPLAVVYRTLSPRGDIRWVDDRTAPLTSDRDEVIGFVGTLEDITGRKQAEDAVRRERDFAERLIQAAQAIVLVLDRDGRIVRFNPFLERLTGRSPDEVRGADWFVTFVTDGDRSGARAAFERALVEPDGSHSTHSIVAADDREREVKWSNRALAGVVGDSPGVLVIGHDVTDLKEAQRRAVQAERLAAIGQMAAGLAHEGRNALQRGQACLEMLALRLKDRPEALDLVAGAQQAQDDLHRLYEEVRSYAAPIRLDRRTCRLREILGGAWERLELTRKGREVRLREQGAPDAACEGDPFRLIQVFRNILDNALAACDDPVEIEVAWSEAELDGRPAVRIAVRDDGPGLTAEQRRNLFEPFYTTKTQGTGLGMAIARRIVEAHGGVIAAGPVGGLGATILITLPRGEV